MNDELSSLKSAMLGHAVADAMGVPVEFESRETLKKDPVTGYRGYGSHSVPAGTWSDDTSMNLASLDSFGLDYTAPVTDGRPFPLLRLLIRLPKPMNKYREPNLNTPDKRRQK